MRPEQIAQLAYIQAIQIDPSLAEHFPVPAAFEEGSSGGGCLAVFGYYHNLERHVMVTDNDDGYPTESDYQIGFYNEQGEWVRSFFWDSGDCCLKPSDMREQSQGKTKASEELALSYDLWLAESKLPKACMRELRYFAPLDEDQEQVLEAFIRLWDLLESEEA